MPSRRHNTSLSSVIAARLPGIGSGDTVMPAIGSTAKGASVARRRFQRGSVFKNRPKTVWLGQYSNYVLETHGVEKRQRTQICLGPVRKFDGSHMTKREAQRLLQPYVDRVNASIAFPVPNHKNATFEAFSKIWERDYLCLSKPSTRCTMRGQLKRLTASLGNKDMRQIDAGDFQRVIAKMEVERRSPKTIRNLWSTTRLIWEAALAQRYVDTLLPKPNSREFTRRYLGIFDLGVLHRLSRVRKANFGPSIG